MLPPHSDADPAVPHGSVARDADELLRDLNPAQREAVTHRDGPLLVLAGAGSGKTRAITHRIAHLILGSNVHPGRIVAVTFTNKAAGEMRERVMQLLGGDLPGGWIGTFHALCLRILRREGKLIGLRSGFNVYDTDDQQAVVKRLVAELGGDQPALPPRVVRSRISREKNALGTPEALEQRAFGPEQQLTLAVWRRYEQALRQANAVDFDDLLLRSLELFHEHPDVAREYSERCQYLLVDEYQDTNRPQYLLVRTLSAVHGNVCVVGDEDQCIYRFRGAELRNILDFEHDHPGSKVVRLEQNYRSTATILEAASAVVARNVMRKGKTLWTENVAGERIELHRAPDDRAEAVWVAQRVKRLAASQAHESMAVLYRTNAQSRQLEEVFRSEGIPYQVVGSVGFYERREVKDLLAYLKLAVNPADDVGYRRVVNTPPRGVGDSTLEVVERRAAADGVPLLEATRRVIADSTLAARAARALGVFVRLIDELSSRTTEESAAPLIERVLELTDFPAYLERIHGDLASERMENVRSLITAAVEYEEETDEPSLEGFLDRSALVADADAVGESPGVTLMTVHCAKGLEFATVFLVGLEENLFPHTMASGSDEDVEEERRLCYVALTRARERLLLSHARFRRMQGSYAPARASRFLDEIPAKLMDVTGIAEETSFFDAPAFGRAWSGGGSAAQAALIARRRENPPARSTPKPAVPAGRVQKHEDGLDVGRFVRHPRFGTGRIVEREGSGRNIKLTIDFSGQGRKKILPAYTRLELEV